MTAPAIQRFLQRQPTTPSALLEEYLASPGAQDRAPLDFLRRASIYEFPWGFVAEAAVPSGTFRPGLGGYFWECYAQQVWRTGTAPWFDRFLTAWKCLGAPLVERVIEERRVTTQPIVLSFDDGISNWSTMSFASLGGDPEAGRAFFADPLLRLVLPDLIAKALDPGYVFPTAWRCIGPRPTTQGRADPPYTHPGPPAHPNQNA